MFLVLRNLRGGVNKSYFLLSLRDRRIRKKKIVVVTGGFEGILKKSSRL